MANGLPVDDKKEKPKQNPEIANNWREFKQALKARRQADSSPT